jgi:hypothetical protein
MKPHSQHLSARIRLCGWMTLLLMAAMPAITPAAQLTVFPGESIQAKITAAAAGDEIVIFEGTYSEDLTINKNVVLRKPEGAAVFLTGNVTLSGITTAYTLANFKIGADRTKRLYINNCTDVVAQDLDLTDAYGVDSSGTAKLRIYRVDNTGGTDCRIVQCSDFEAKNCVFGNFSSVGSKLVLRQGVYGTVLVDKSNCYCLGATMTRLEHQSVDVSGAAGTGPSTLVCFRCTLPTGDGMLGSISSRSTYNWIGYNSAKTFYLRYWNVSTPVNASALVVGNTFDQKFSHYDGVKGVDGDHSRGGVVCMSKHDAANAVSIKVMNNVIKRVGRTQVADSWWGGDLENGIFMNGKISFYVLNNLVHDVTLRQQGSRYGGVRSNGIAYNNGAKGLIANNVLYNIADGNEITNFGDPTFRGHSIGGTSDGTTISGNFIHRPGVNGFAPGYQAIISPSLNVLGTGAPTFEDAATYTLPADSPLKNAGINDPRFNDFDGTRNDIGIWGGTQFDPEGRTTYKPVVLGFDLTPDQTLDGVTNEVQLLNIGAVVLDP